MAKHDQILREVSFSCTAEKQHIGIVENLYQFSNTVLKVCSISASASEVTTACCHRNSIIIIIVVVVVVVVVVVYIMHDDGHTNCSHTVGPCTYC